MMSFGNSKRTAVKGNLPVMSLADFLFKLSCQLYKKNEYVTLPKAGSPGPNGDIGTM